MEKDPKRESIIELIKKGNKSSAIAMIGNAVLATAKGFAASFSGNGTMLASAMHSLADAVNQGFVFIGSILSEKKPTRRFPTGFGRVINIFCMIAVIVVTVMAYETIREGWHLIQHPVKSGGFLLNVAVLLLNVLIDGFILIKAMKEITVEARVETKGMGLGLAGAAFKNVGRATPPTRLVFYEDMVAVTGALLALIAILVTTFTNFALLDGVASILIGLLMVGVAFRVGYDNMVGLIGVSAPSDVEEKVVNIILADPDVTDINKIRVIQEGRSYHVEALIELQKGLSLADADDIKFRVKDRLIEVPDIADVLLGIIEDNGVQNWRPQHHVPLNLATEFGDENDIHEQISNHINDSERNNH